MKDSTKSRRSLAMDFEDAAARELQVYGPSGGDISAAQVSATLALCCRVAELTERLGDYLGDDSNLDRIAQGLFDSESGMSVAEGIEHFRKTLEERPV